MNKKLLGVALLGGLCVAQTALAQDFDDRWYVAGSTGVNFQDSDRDTEDAIFGTLGFGKFLNPNWSVDFEANYQNPDKTANPNLWWSQYGAVCRCALPLPQCGPHLVARTCAWASASSAMKKSSCVTRALGSEPGPARRQQRRRQPRRRPAVRFRPR